MDAPESVDLVETDEKHGFSIRLREGATRWLRRWLLGIDAPVREKAIKLPEEKSLYCTPEGQVLRVAGARSLFDLLGARSVGLDLTESFAMTPAASVSGLYFSHPQSKYFAIQRIGRDQVTDYARRKGMEVNEVERWLRPVLAYEPSLVSA